MVHPHARRLALAALALLAGARPAAAAETPLVCFGNEPSWGLSLEAPGSAELRFPDAPPVAYRGGSTRLEPLRERVWRGAPASGSGGDLVAFLRETACSDQMSETVHPVEARVSLPDGRFLAGCCRVPAAAGAAAPSEGAGGGAIALEGPVWRLVRLPGLDANALADPAKAPSLRFEAGRVSGFGGCNRLAGSYALEGGRVTFGPLAGTMMACDEPAGGIEARFTRALAGALRVEVAQGRLTLAPAAGADAALVFEAAPLPRLEGATWEVTGFNNGRHAVVSPLVGSELTLAFADGAVVGHSGCNRFRASYEQDGARLSVGPVAAGRMHCEGKGVMEQEREFLAALATATTWTIDDRGMLDLHRPDGERVLIAHEAAQ